MAGESTSTYTDAQAGRPKLEQRGKRERAERERRKRTLMYIVTNLCLTIGYSVWARKRRSPERDCLRRSTDHKWRVSNESLPREECNGELFVAQER